MGYRSFKDNDKKEYLGFCEQKGYIYSIATNKGTQVIVAIKNGQVSVLIEYTINKEGIQGE